MKIKYIWLLVILVGFFSCDDLESPIPEQEVIPELTSGTADFSNYVALGASFTAGFTDNALFKASQQNSFPNMLASKFALAGGGDFTQPLMNDNFGGLAANGNRITDPRLVFNGSAPAGLETVIGPVTVSTDIVLNNPTGPFNNLGVPGAKSFHLVAEGFGNLQNFPTAANPYAIRITGGASNASILDLALEQNPTFFTLSEIGGNDVLGYAISGGDGTNTITDATTFNNAFGFLVSELTKNGAKGVVTTVPYITDLAHFTTVPHNPVPLNEASANQINNGYAQYNGGLATMVTLGQITQEEADKRTIQFMASATNAVVIEDENLTDLSTFGIPSYRHATAEDLLVLPALNFIGTAVNNDPTKLNGITVPLKDKWVLTPEEQMEISTATDTFNATITSVANANENVALLDLNAILTELASTGIMFDGYSLKSSLVTGGAISLDGIHLTARGYALMANKFLEIIDSEFGSNFKVSGNLLKASNYQTNYTPALQ
ncbi:G-D-S-L family lipolytic protein [Seonamhaeicola algicola]|uniref:G-D-S-L family lipolytic protein n=1 Tax=Seonamhaeicola algicola TaxID=1719036 RepID=A0A5C7AWV2_9FLAO|nr:G-D-S-L family lipolytic protein [Seonamhaeicola algicola]TXE13158.1 G-D-S-L family lipolytic protein [Seonamhaeicola algicola]